MKKFITMLLRHWAKSPLKIILTLSAVALGTGILILSFSASSILEEEVSGQLDENGVIMYVANGEWDSDGTVEQNRPSEWDSNALDFVLSDVDTIKNAAVIFRIPFNQFTTNGTSYDLRSAVGSDSQYFDVFGLDIIAGAPMSAEDIDMGQKKVWITEEMAVALYGSAEEAIGNYIQPPGEMMQRGPGQREQNVIISYNVAGVFETPAEVTRRAYGIGDLIFPYTSMVTGGSNVQRMLDFMSGLFVVRSEGASAAKTRSSVNQVLTANYGDDIDILVWEGSVNGESSYMQELRSTVDMFTVSVNILGIVLLLTSSLGIFSIMVVESLSRRREIALERALGASQQLVVREFWSWSLTLSLVGAVIGVILALILATPVMGSISPLLGEVSGQFQADSGIKLSALFTAVFMALGFGGVLGLLPALSAVKGNIAETIREV
ncbi:MAG: ABC transporter permease [Spirochaetales bacterium]|uniref:ABC transporter permease n=1 Tax=Candidatus Thalassospirochaeta sargassi TaxID=3119039 RepID=A0AAJ1ICA4_9SPIO|nr:ABC transporter permease [Spirochaetales bacterium]